MRGHRLGEIRANRGLSRADLAARCDINEKQIWRYEKDAAQPTSGHLTKICRELAVSADYLLGLVDEVSETFVGQEFDEEGRELLSLLHKHDTYSALRGIEILTKRAIDAYHYKLLELKIVKKELNSLRDDKNDA